MAGFGAALTGYAVGRGLGAFPVVVVLIFSLVAFYLTLTVHAIWVRAEEPDWRERLAVDPARGGSA